MFKKALTSVMALAMVAATALPTSQPAEARGRFAAGVAAGIIGLGVLGAYAHARDREYYGYRHRVRECHEGPEECGWVNRRCFTNSWGDRVCRGGRWTCWRDSYCD